ncbi:MAG: ImmA/IrrE family metallo-endopeptidase [Chloroflexi bacterium]|nr:ImmA/IrrE family metallo-endopeptidase [Chloroflexota bacterium]
MTRPVQGVRGTVLRWAREAQGFSIDDVAKLMKREPGAIAAWEDDADEMGPTYAQLEELAYRHYKRPLAAFFLPNPPKETSLEQDFRTLPGKEIEALAPDTRYHVRLGRAYQISLEELNEGENQSERKIFQDMRVSTDSDVAQSAVAIRAYLQVSRSDQIGWDSSDLALKRWRSAVEDAGVFVFKNTFKQKGISAFCLTDPQFPVIYLNNGTAKTRQVFSLFHELSHILLSMNSITKLDQSYISSLPAAGRRIEQFCNSLAAEILIPSDDFSAQLGTSNDFSDNRVQFLASRYAVSREAVLRRLLDLGLVEQSHYEEKSKQWAEEAEAAARTGGGGNYYYTKAAYLGNAYLKLVFQRHYQGRITTDQVGDYLGVKTKYIPRFEELALGSPAS